MSFLPRTEEENVPFIELGVEGSLREETNLAAFLACCLCKFALPAKNFDNIRPSVFKVSSLMAHKERFSLAIPILVSIYRGFKEISSSSILSASDIILPIQYVYGWIGAYFDTYHQSRHHNGACMCKIGGERMAKYFDLIGAQRLFQDVNIHHLHHLAILQSKDLSIVDSGDLSSSWNDYFISLRSSHLTVRRDDRLIVEPYNPHRFSRQFGFNQDLPGNPIEPQYNDTLQELVQLWDSCTCLGSSSTVVIPPFPERPLMTCRHANWWLTGRTNLFGQNKIVLICSKRDDTQASSKVCHSLTQAQNKSSSSSLIKSQVSQSSKFLTSKGVLVRNGNRAKLRLSTSKLSITPSVVLNKTSKRKDPPISSEKANRQLSPSMVSKDKTSITFSDEVVDANGDSSSTEGDPEQDQHWNRKRKKVEDQNSNLHDLDTINIDSETFFVDSPSSIMPLPELAEQLGIKGASTKTFSGIIDEGGATSPSYPEISFLPPPKSLENKLELATLNFEPQQMISTFKMHYISKMWSALCEWMTGFSLNSRDRFSKLKDGVNLILEEIKGTNAVNTSTLVGFVKAFSDTYEEYDTMKLSSSQKMTKECHKKLLSDVQQRLIKVKEESTKVNGRMEVLQAILEKVDLELKALSAKKKKTIARIEEQKKQLSKNQEKIIAFEGEIHVIEESRPLSEDEVQKLSKLEEAVETSRQQILEFKPFP